MYYNSYHFIFCIALQDNFVVWSHVGQYLQARFFLLCKKKFVSKTSREMAEQISM